MKPSNKVLQYLAAVTAISAEELDQINWMSPVGRLLLKLAHKDKIDQPEEVKQARLAFAKEKRDAQHARRAARAKKQQTCYAAGYAK